MTGFTYSSQGSNIRLFPWRTIKQGCGVPEAEQTYVYGTGCGAEFFHISNYGPFGSYITALDQARIDMAVAYLEERLGRKVTLSEVE